MQQLKNQNGLLLQLVTGLQNQINSKNRQNQILFQQYDQLAQDNATLRTQIETLRAKIKHYELIKPERKSDSSIPSPKELHTQDLKNKLENAQQEIKTLHVELEQKGGMIILLQSQLTQLKIQPTPLPPQPANQSWKTDLQTKITELEQSLTNKQNTINELTQYMNDQANKINELTKESIATINNYEAKLEEKDKELQELKKVVLQQQNQAKIQEEINQNQPTVLQLQEGCQIHLEVQKVSHQELLILKEKVLQLQAMLSMKEQSISQLSQFLQSQTEKASKLQSQLSESKVLSLEEQLSSLKQIIASKEQSMAELSQFLQTLSTKGGENDQKILSIEKQHQVRRLQWQQQKEQMMKQIKMIKQQLQSKAIEVDNLSEESGLKSSPMIDEIHVKLSTKEDEVNRLNEIIRDKQASNQELLEKNLILANQLQEVQSRQEKQQEKETLQQLRATLEAKQKYIDEFSEYMNEQLVNVKQLTSKLQACQEKEVLGKQNDEELKLQLQSKDKNISDFTQYMNEQLKVVAELTEKLRFYEEKEAQKETGDHQDQLKQKQQQYETIIQELQQELQSKKKQIDQFSQYMNDQLKIVTELKEKLQYYEEQSPKQEAKQAEKITSDQRAAYEKTISQLQKKLHKKDKEIKELNSYIKEELNTVQELTQKLQAFAEDKEKEEQSQLHIEENQIIVFSEKIQQLQQILKSKEESLNEMSQYFEQYYVTKSKLEEDIVRLHDQNSALKQQIQDLKQQIQDLRQAKIHSTIDKSIPEENQKRILQLQEQLSQKSKLQEQLEREIKTIKQLKLIIDQKEEQLTNLLSKVDQKNTDYRDLQQIISAKTETIAELSSFMNEQAERLAELQGLVQKYQAEKNQGTSSEYRQSTQRRNMNEDNLIELNEKIQKLEKIIQEKDETIAGLSDLVEQREENIKQLRTESIRQNQQSSQFNLDPQKIAELQALISNQGETIQLLKEQTQVLETREEQLQNELDNIESQHQKLSEENKKLKEQLQILLESNQSSQKSHKSKRSSYRTSEVFKEEMSTLKQKIIDLEETLQAKAETIKELSEYMNQQATKLVELQSKELSKSGESQKIEDRHDKIKDLQMIIKSKEESISELTEYLNENYTKIIALEQQIKDLEAQLKKNTAPELKQLQSAPTLSEIVRQQRQQSMLIELQQAILQKKDILNQLELAIDQKELQLSFIKNEIADQNSKLQQARLRKLEAEEQVKDINILKQQQIRNLKVNEQNQQTENRQQMEQFFRQKEQEINSITQILEKLQEELRSKNQRIQQLQHNLNTQKGRSKQVSNKDLQQQPELSQNNKDQQIQQLQAEVQTLREQHKQLIQRLDKQQDHLILQEEYDIIGLEDGMKRESQKYSQNLKQQLEELKQSGKKTEKESVRALKDSIQRQQASQLSQMREERLTTTELLSQLMLYSDEGANMRAIRVLIASLSQKYHRQLVEYQNESGQLKETVESLIELNQNLNLEVRNFRESLKEKEHIIQELQEINNQKQNSYQQKLEEIRQSLTMLGSEVPNFLNKILEAKEQSPQRQSLKASQKYSLKNQRTPSRSILNESQSKKLKDQIKELKQQIQKLREESHLKDKELQQLRQLRTSKNKTYERQLQDLLMDSNAKEDPSIQLQQLQAQKEKLVILCSELERKLNASQREKKQQAEMIQKLNDKINYMERPGGITLSAVVGGQDQNSRTRNDISSKVLADLEENVPSRGKQSEKGGWRQSNGVQEASMESRILEKQQIIIELQQTILNLEKGFNNQIIDLRRNIAELQAEVISLRKHLYIADPTALDVAQLVRETCTQQSKPNQFFKPTYKLRYTNNINNSFNYSPAQPNQNSSFYTQSRRNNYEPYYNKSELTLGQKMMGRRIKQDYPLNLTINNQFKVHNSAWEMSKIPQM